jgi:ferritin-like metal-binding protein YciE
MQAGTFRSFYISELKKTHDAEKQLIAALPALIQAASSEQLREVFNRHLEQTKDHATRVEMILQAQGEPAAGEKCAGMECLISDLEKLRSQGLSRDVLDAALVSYAQRIEHFEIASYGSLRDYAAALDDRDTAMHLQNTLEEEQDADRQLTNIGRTINAELAKQETSGSKTQIPATFAEPATRIKPAA